MVYDEDDDPWDDIYEHLDAGINSNLYSNDGVDANPSSNYESVMSDFRIQDSFVDPVDQIGEDLRPHYETVKGLYENGRYDLATVILSPFFETILSESLLENTDHGIVEEIEADGFVDFEDKLNVAEKEGIIDPTEYRVLDNLRNIRNAAIHDIEFFDPKADSEEVKEKRETASKIIDSSIELYEELLDIDLGIYDHNSITVASKYSNPTNIYTENHRTREESVNQTPRTSEEQIYRLVRESHQLGFDSAASILLNNYLENNLDKAVKSRIEEIRTPVNSPSLEKHMEFSSGIPEIGLYFGIIDEMEYEFVQRVQTVRKEYAHNLEAFSDNEVKMSDEEIEFGLSLLNEHMGVGYRNPISLRTSLETEENSLERIEPADSFSKESWMEVKDNLDSHLNNILQNDEKCFNSLAPAHMGFKLKTTLANNLGKIGDNEFRILTNPDKNWEEVTSYHEEVVV